MVDKEGFSRKDLRAPDAFMETAGRLNRFIATAGAAENRVRLIAAVVGLAVIVAGGIAVKTYGSRAREIRAAAFARATAAIESESRETAKAGFAALTKRGGDTYPALAMLQWARLLADEGLYSEAIEAYSDFVDRAPAPYFRQSALMGKARALAASGSDYQALEALALAAEIEGPYRLQALERRLELARRTGDGEARRKSIDALLELQPSRSDANELATERAGLNE